MLLLRAGARETLCGWCSAGQQQPRATPRELCSRSGPWLQTTRMPQSCGTRMLGRLPAQAACGLRCATLAGMRQKYPESIPIMLLLGNSYTLAVSLT